MSVTIKGTVCAGAGKSSKWMKTYIPFLFPGTINIKLDNVTPEIIYNNTIETQYGNCLIADCKINNLSAYLVLPPRKTLNNFYVEIGHQEKLRDKLELTTGSEVYITF